MKTDDRQAIGDSVTKAPRAVDPTGRRGRPLKVPSLPG